MKKIVLLSILFLSFSLFSQKVEKISQSKCIPKKGYHLQLKKVVNDSRCPEGVNCIWAGEADVVIAVYLNKKFIKDHTLKISSKNLKENVDWFSNYFPNIKISKIDVFPSPKDGVVLNPKKYFIKISSDK